MESEKSDNKEALKNLNGEVAQLRRKVKTLKKTTISDVNAKSMLEDVLKESHMDVTLDSDQGFEKVKQQVLFYNLVWVWPS